MMASCCRCIMIRRSPQDPAQCFTLETVHDKSAVGTHSIDSGIYFSSCTGMTLVTQYREQVWLARFLYLNHVPTCHFLGHGSPEFGGLRRFRACRVTSADDGIL